MKIIAMLATAIVALTLTACDGSVSSGPRSGAAEESHQTEITQAQLANTVGMPAITHGTEKRLMKWLYELRDNPKLTTYTYVMDMYGRFHKICPTTSVGYGIPFSAQYTAPSVDKMQTSAYKNAAVTITKMQPEPNGLYMPTSSDATWVLCLAADGKTIEPSYIEHRVLVFLHPRKAVD